MIPRGERLGGQIKKPEVEFEGTCCCWCNLRLFPWHCNDGDLSSSSLMLLSLAPVCLVAPCSSLARSMITRSQHFTFDGLEKTLAPSQANRTTNNKPNTEQLAVERGDGRARFWWFIFSTFQCTFHHDGRHREPKRAPHCLSSLLVRDEESRKSRKTQTIGWNVIELQWPRSRSSRPRARPRIWREDSDKSDDEDDADEHDVDVDDDGRRGWKTGGLGAIISLVMVGKQRRPPRSRISHM